MSVLTVGAEDRGRTVSVHRGDHIVLRLPENPTTGYRWEGEIPPFLRLVRDENEPGQAPGAAGLRVMEFVAAAAGRAEMNLQCVRSWEPDQATERFRVSVEAS